MTDAITREEKLMKAIATGSPSNIKPITREEMFLAKAGGQDVETPEPITRREKLLQGIIDSGGGGGSTGGGGDIDAMIDGSISGEIVSNVTEIRKSAFERCSKITSVKLPRVEIMGDCVHGSSAFAYCDNLVSVDAELVKKIWNNAFYNCYNLTTINMPNLEFIANSAFNGCSSLTTIDFPLVTDIQNNGFSYCGKLTTVNLPLVKKLNTQTFRDCKLLSTIDFPLVTDILSSAFYECQKLTTLVLRSETVCTLSNVNAFQNTPFRGYNGLIGTAYVPQALIEEYKIATNWSTLYAQGTCNFVAIEGSEYDV